MEKLITRKEAAKILGISIATLDAARQNGLISYVQYVPNGCVYFTEHSMPSWRVLISFAGVACAKGGVKNVTHGRKG